MSLYDPCLWVCHQFLVFNPAVRRNASGEGEMCSCLPSSRLILTFCYCLYKFLREQKLRTDRLPDTDKANSFQGQTSWVRFNNCVPDFQDAMELWALRPTWILGKVISVCRIHVFFHQYVADLRDERSENVLLLMSALKDSQPEGENYVLQSAIRKEKSENVLRTIATSPVIFDMAVCRTSGVIAAPPESSAGAAQPLNTGVNILYDVNMGSPSVIPPDLGIKRPVMQPQNLQIDRMSESRPSLSLLSFLASSSALTLTQIPAQFSSSSSSIDRSQPVGGKISPPPGEALLPPPAADCLISSLEDPNTAVRHEPCPRSESPCDVPAHATVQAVPSAGPSDSSDWVSLQNIYVSVREIFDRYSARDPGGGRVTTLWTAESFMRLLGVQEICCIPMETRPTYCCCFLFRAGLLQDIRSRSGPGFGVLFIFRLPVYVLLRRDCLPRSDCVIHLLLLHEQLTVTRMILWWNLLAVGALPGIAMPGGPPVVDKTMEVVRRIPISLPLRTGLVFFLVVTDIIV